MAYRSDIYTQDTLLQNVPRIRIIFESISTTFEAIVDFEAAQVV